MTAFWLTAIVVFIVVECATAGLASVWFVIGSIAALVATWCGSALWLQIALFVAVSVVSLVLTRPILVDKLSVKREPTNFDRVLSMNGVVVEAISNQADTGAVKVDGKEWKARSQNGDDIPAGTAVRAHHIDGVTLYVKTVE